ncbi:beta strand repeat-containing protein [Burkholderia pseudomallei]|uniref:beta strand repeat-containing protein n=1 Tax=Burkholderia pseudomallei TaxID=28450 RepID=UPI000F2B74EC|nr:hypothetical protein [Burkholderia pseudomallei]CAJ3071372.1 Uncharacterised protein [Burkholderia pseudomallei]VCK72927.1 Uncharacterised protein [Burkholderia pseudomallei]VCK79949.1 Uncharacterised protein [Burkholderia pseudomallei]VCK80073.1 Uncharacterised protein [Burkholderia pseudomallei]VCK80828.1 Uncharacterised protein [Burkholderia pseudomallei]
MFALSLLRFRLARCIGRRRQPAAATSPIPRPMRLRVLHGSLVGLLAFSWLAPGISQAAGALPGGFQVTGGHATMTSTPNSVNVGVTTPVAMINWNNGMSVGAGNSFNFTNNSGTSSALAVNVDTSGRMTSIAGAVNGFGPGMNLIFVNPQGIALGSGSSVNTTGAAVFAAGTAKVAPGADGAAPQVEITLNNAPSTVASGASLHGAGSLPIGPGQQVQMVAGTTTATVPSMVGSINATLTGAAGTTFELANGALAGDSLSLATNGTLNVDNSNVAAGSKLVLTSPTVNIANSTLTAGAGSSVEIGGGERGQDSSVANANDVSVDANSAITTGAGSNVSVWSNDQTTFNGSITNPGGSAEVSSAGDLNVGFTASFNLRDGNRVGQLTFDPNLLDITAGGTGSVGGSTYATGGYSTISGLVVSNALQNASVLLQGITGVQVDDIIAGGPGSSLALASGGSISFTANGHVNLLGGNFTATINDTNAPAGAVGTNAFGNYGSVFVMAPGSSISTGGGNVTVAPGSYGGVTVGAVQINSGATINAGGGNIALTGVGLSAAQGANSITGTGVSVGGGTGGVATLSTTGAGQINLTGTGGSATGGDGVDLQTGSIVNGSSNAPVAQTDSGAIVVIGTGGTNAQGEQGVAIGSNGIGSNSVGNTLQSTSGNVQLTGTSSTGVGVALLGAQIATGGNVSVTASGAQAANGGATNAQLTSQSESAQGFFANQGASIGAQNIEANADSAALFGATLSATGSITGSIAGGLNLTGGSETANSIQWSAGALQANGPTFTAPTTTLSSAGDLLDNGSVFNGDADLAAGPNGELMFGLTTTSGSLGNAIGGSANPTSATGTLTGTGGQIDVQENLSAQNLVLGSQNSLTIGTAAQAAAHEPGPTVQASNLLSLSVDDKNTNTGIFDPTSVLDNFGTATSLANNVQMQLAAPTGTTPLTVTVNPVVTNPLPADNDPDVPHPGYTWTPNTPPAAQTETVQTANNQLGNLAQYETSTMQAPGSSAYFTAGGARTVYNEESTALTPQTYLPGVWTLNSTPPSGGGGTTTPPSNGGGTTTPPSGGGTTTPPSNGGGTTTPPSSGGGETTPPTTPPVSPPVTPPSPPTVPPQPPAQLPTQALPAAVAPTTIVATPTTSAPTLQGNVLYVPSSNTPAAAGATLSLPQVSTSADTTANPEDSKKAR